MVKIFTTNKNGKIEFTEKELENLLNEVWKDGYNSNKNSYWWCSPTNATGTITTPYTISCVSTSTNTKREGE